MTGTAEQFVGLLNSWLGTAEQPDGSNRTWLGREYGWDGVPWCAITLSVAFKRVGLGAIHTASTDQLEASARAHTHGLTLLAASSTPRRGDIAVWDFIGDGTPNHVSVVEAVLSGGRLQTLGGNEGNAVRRAVRSRGALRSFVRAPFGAAPESHTPPPRASGYAHYPGGVFKLRSPMTRHPFVRTIQHVTISAGCGPTKARGGEDGIFGAATRDAVVCWQRKIGVAADGAWGPVTQARTDQVLRR